jgi:glycosyltransferase involved in cell wall biosynthesis
MKIAFLTAYDPLNRRTGSGSLYYMLQALQNYCGEVNCLGPMRVKEQLFGRVLNKGSQMLLRKRYPYYISFLLARRYAQIAMSRLAENHFDVIVAPFGTVGTAFLETDIPIVLIEDATFALLHNYYPHYSNLLNTSVGEAHLITHMAFQRASALVFSSEWAAFSAEEDYAVAAEKIYIVPFGANIEKAPEQEMLAQRLQEQRCKLLFVGVDWQRKGGDIAFETLAQLEKMDIPASLTVCGCKVPPGLKHPHLHVIPFLDINVAEQRHELERLYREAHFLLLPTRGDCTPHVFCEASAFGLPVITTCTGGVHEVVREGVNGFTLPYEARGDAYARLIANIFRNRLRYTMLSQSSRTAFESNLNWDAWGQRMHALLREIISIKC